MRAIGFSDCERGVVEHREAHVGELRKSAVDSYREEMIRASAWSWSRSARRCARGEHRHQSFSAKILPAGVPRGGAEGHR
jgi:hypothetical protein